MTDRLLHISMRQRKGKMVEKKTKSQLVPLDELAEPVAYFYPMIIDDDEMDEDYKHYLLNFLKAAPNGTHSKNDDEMDEDDEHCLSNYSMAAPSKMQRENDDEMDEDFKHYLLNRQMAAVNKKRRDNDYDEEEDDDRYHEEVYDPDYELFLENLKAHEQSYILEFEGEENGSIVRVRIKYEERLSPDREGNLEPRRKLRSAAKQMNGDSNQILCLENHRKHNSQSEEKLNADKEWGLEPRRKLRTAAKQMNGDSNQILCLENQRKHDSQSEEKLNADKEWGLEPRRKLRSAAKHINGDSTQILGLENHQKHDSQSEEKLDSDKDWGHEPRRRILKSASNHINGDSTQILGLENHRKHNSRSSPTKATVKLPEGKLGNKTNSEKGNYRKISNLLEDVDEVEDDFLTWMQGLEVFDNDYCVFSSGGYNVECNKEDRECDLVNEEYNNESSSDVEYLGSRFDKDEKSDFSLIIEDNAFGMDDAARFRRKVIAALRKPYNRQEYNGLLQAVEFRKPEERHLDLRHGRERSYPVQKEGKSYLDYYPDFERKLLQFVDDKPRCLNLLRGFFIWLKQPEAFAPWKDAELLAIKPRSG